ncbi:MAG: hypothetical protein JXN60_01525 [Lentisphaerae bacterium]|nr:hypothetical protein [Lentisphaerota bacterium]
MKYWKAVLWSVSVCFGLMLMIGCEETNEDGTSDGIRSGYTSAWSGQEIPEGCEEHYIYTQYGTALHFANSLEQEAFINNYTTGIIYQGEAGHGYYVVSRTQAYEEPLYGGTCDNAR